LLDPRLGNDQFALTLSTELWQPQVRIPPAGLPPLPLTLNWQVGEGCGSDDRLLDQPHGVTIDLARQRILVADTANRRVVTFNLAGELVGSLRDERFAEPFDLDLGADGAPLLLDALAQQIFRLDPINDSVEPLQLAESFYRPRGIGTQLMNGLLVADTGGGRVVILSADNATAGQFGGRDSLLGRGQPVDALATNGALWAVTAEDGRLWQLDSGGSLLAVQPTNTLNGPHLAGLPGGTFFVSDPARSLVLYFSANGQPRAQLATMGSLVTPTGVAAVQSNEVVYLAIVDSATCTLSWWQALAPALSSLN
jgi:hypothetical protein